MARFMVDSNVILDVLTEDERWYEWSSRTLEQCSEEEPLVVNPVVFAEVSGGFDRIEDLNLALPEGEFERRRIPWEAAFLAGKCFREYRRRGGRRSAPLPDFFIGAHAEVEGLGLITRDAARYRTYFPKLDIISPEQP